MDAETEGESLYDDTPETAPVIAPTQRSIDAAKVRELRNGPVFKKLRADFRAEGERQRNPDGSTGAPCWLDGADINYCVAPGTLVLCTDLLWRPADQLFQGEEIIGFDEQPPVTELGRTHAYRKFRRATIEQKERLTTPCVEVTTDDGSTVVCSDKHRWLVLSGKTLRWKPAAVLGLGDTLISVGQPWTEDMTREGGYLAGIFDGEGTVSGPNELPAGARRTPRQLGFAQMPGPVLDRATEALKVLGINYASYGRSKDTVVTVVVRGGVWQAIQTLGTLRPVRLIAKADRLWEGAALSRSGARKTRVVAIHAVGEREVIGLRTSTATFIANGLLTHNSLQYPHPYSWSLDHAITAKERPDLLLDPLNFRHSHLDCNIARGTDDPPIDIGEPSELW